MDEEHEVILPLVCSHGPWVLWYALANGMFCQSRDCEGLGISVVLGIACNCSQRGTCCCPFAGVLLRVLDGCPGVA